MPGAGFGCRSTRSCWLHSAERSRRRSVTAPSPSTSADRAVRSSNLTSTCGGRSAGSPPSIPSLSPARRTRTSARQLLDEVHETLKAVPHYGIGYGLLRYMYAPTARLLGARVRRTSSSPTWARFPTCRPCHPTMLPFNSMPTRRCRCARRSRALVMPSNSGCIARLMCCIWIGGMTPVGSSRPWRNRLPSGFSIALMELTREAMVEDEMESAGEELALVDLSSSDIGIGEANARH